MADEPIIYLDTNIVSALFYAGMDSTAVSRRIATKEWWDHERRLFNVVTSAFVEAELTQGILRGQKAAIATARRIAFLPDRAYVRACAKQYLEKKVVPISKPGDAAHLAFASVYRADYLLSWNHSHLANDEVQAKLELLNRRLGLRTPLLRSPVTMPRAALGQTIRRRS